MSWRGQPANQVEMFFHQFLKEDRFGLGYETTPAEKLAASLMSVTLLYEAMKGNFQIDPSILREFIRDYTEICELPNLHLENFPKQRMSPEIISIVAWDFLNMIPDVTMNDLKGISQVQADYCSRVFPTIYPKVYATIWPFQRKAAA